jgi:hypothetical protein
MENESGKFKACFNIFNVYNKLTLSHVHLSNTQTPIYENKITIKM